MPRDPRLDDRSQKKKKKRRLTRFSGIAVTKRKIPEYSEMQTYAVKHVRLTREMTKQMSRQGKICHLKLASVCSSHFARFFTKFALLSAGSLLSSFDAEHCRSQAVTSIVQVWTCRDGVFILTSDWRHQFSLLLASLHSPVNLVQPVAWQECKAWMNSLQTG